LVFPIPRRRKSICVGVSLLVSRRNDQLERLSFCAEDQVLRIAESMMANQRR
jgi:hypothetical protein